MLDQARSLVQHGTAPTDEAVQTLVRTALRRDLTQPAGLELTALSEASSGHQDATARLYHLSDRISRRSLATRLWLVQDAVGRGDVPTTLANMDLALRTSSAAPQFLFPALARGLDDATLVEPIAALTDRPSDWREAFLIYVADNAEPLSAAALLTAVRDRQVVAKDELDRKVIVRLVGEGQFARARQLDAAFTRRPATTQLLRDGSFGDPASRYPFGWGLTDKGELGASREIENGRPVLAYHANAAASGQVAAQLLTLPPGSYTLATTVGGSKPAENPPVWTISCAPPARLVATLALPAGAGGRSAASFTVPSGCAAQWLALTVQPALASQAGSVDEITITAR